MEHSAVTAMAGLLGTADTGMLPFPGTTEPEVMHRP
jgi:hypothetical protein